MNTSFESHPIQILFSDTDIQANNTPTMPTMPIERFLSCAVWDWGKKRGTKTGTITSFSTTFQVPPAPRTRGNQKIFIFNGMQPISGVARKAVLSPVLRWGIDGGQWSIINSYVEQSTNGEIIAVATRAIDVEPGETLTGIISLESRGNDYYRYSSKFSEYPDSQLVIQISEELVQAGLALEALYLEQCGNFPNAMYTRFEDIRIDINGFKAKPEWEENNQDNECGTCITTSSHDNEALIRYR